MSLLFDVVLFIRKNVTELNLSMAERIVMFSLAGRIGNHKDTWVSQKTLSEECGVSDRYLRQITTLLEDKKIIKTEKSGRNNRYSLLIQHRNCSSAIEDEQRNHSSGNVVEYRNHSSGVRGTTVPVSLPKKPEIPIINPELMPPPKNLKETMKETLKANRQSLVENAPSRFDDFWAVYPSKENKKKAKAVWTKKKLDLKADMIIADVIRRKACHKKWLEGFIPHPTTYLNGERWEDEITEVIHAESRATGQLSPHQACLKRGWDVIKDGNWH